MCYWKDIHGNIYGPFSMQDDGFPNAGEVIQHYRALEQISRKKLAEHLGVHPRWVTKMENENRVPELISRRRTIASILKVPPVLLGLASIGDFIRPLEASHPSTAASAINVLVDETTISQYQEDLRICWGLHFTSAAHPSFQAIELKALQIEELAPSISETQRGRLLSVSSGYRRLLSRVARDQQDFPVALIHINRSIELAECTGRAGLCASSYLTRGRTRFEQGNFDLAAQDLEKALSYVEGWGTQLEGTILLELALARSHTAQTPKEKIAVLHLTDRAEWIIGRTIEDDESFTKLSPGVYHMLRAEVSLILNQPDAPDLLEYATEEISPDQTRRLSYVDILQSTLCLRDGDTAAAVSALERALDVSVAVGSQYNIRRIRELYKQLSTHNTSISVKPLGRRLERLKS